ncbi:MAG TPA: tRNA 2-thiouridine(34) synthase MnmA [Acidimicrobiales bacterium]|nr:tRNA 2-thiouridine(34) synthase MnmA [Acidimicrobiales bacterium]
MRVLVGLSGGVDSSVAAALLIEQGHEVVGATMKLWGGAGDSGCCSVGDVDDARRVAAKLGIDHHVFNFAEDFEERVIAPYVEEHALGRTPNPCIECNRHLKFRRFLDRAGRLGFEAVATGHHARIRSDGQGGRPRLLRGHDPAKDQSYVLSMLTVSELARVLLPVGEFTKHEVRAHAAELGLPTAAKPDSQEVCFVAAGPGQGPRRSFLSERMELHPGRLVDHATGEVVGTVPAVELVTVGQRRGLGLSASRARYAVAIDATTSTVLVGTEQDLLTDKVELMHRTWVASPLLVGTEVLVQVSAHGRPRPAVLTDTGARFLEGLHRRVAPGQTVALYVGDEVVGSGIAA